MSEEHQDYLRFIWHKDNDVKTSPAFAMLGLRKTADIAEETHGKDVHDFIYKNFYVDDALSSHDTSAEAIGPSQLLWTSNLNIHKIRSNSNEVLSAFDKEELSKDLKEMDFDTGNSLPMQRSLGVCWDLNLDVFTYCVSPEDKSVTRRGVLSVINGLYGPIGFTAPVLVAGKLLLREAMSDQHIDWDEALPPGFSSKFETWRNSLKGLEHVQIPRAYSNSSSKVQSRDLMIFSDASEKAIAAVAYIRTVYDGNGRDIRFILGKTKVASKHGHTIPRLELCGAVLGVEFFRR